MLSIDKQIAQMEHSGVTFSDTNKESVKEYLQNNNNYFKLISYRKNFLKHPVGEKKDKYIDLDFSYLKDLAIIDMRLRYVLLHMCLDVEHFSKVRLMKALEESKSDGYDIVQLFLNSVDERQRKLLKAEIERNHGNPYCGDLVDKFSGEIPVWAFIEIIPFGRYIYFYKYCAEHLSNKSMTDEFYLLHCIKELRNAAAHNNCILNDMRPKTSRHRTNYGVLSALSQSKHINQKKMSNARTQQIITLFYAYTKIVTSPGVSNHRSTVLNSLTERMFKNINYYSNSETIRTTFQFIKEVIDNWFPIAYNESN